MRLTKANLNELNYYTRTKNQEIIDEFIRSGLDCAKLEGWTNNSASCCAASINQTIKKMRYHGVKAISRRGQVYLIKIED